MIKLSRQCARCMRSITLGFGSNVSSWGILCAAAAVYHNDSMMNIHLRRRLGSRNLVVILGRVATYRAKFMTMAASTQHQADVSPQPPPVLLALRDRRACGGE